MSSLEKGIRLLTLLGETKPQLRALGPIPKQLTGRHTGWGHPTSAVASPSSILKLFILRVFISTINICIVTLKETQCLQII